ncbi:unnamed protein product, partial [Mesorhabditis belari]|uniref:GB1/RHD3-type G domain-containing protein n=1 Tax=Mesorhabditis belari TaxID=2138241 RepID=A0AAF3EIW0_9BILA
MESLVSFENDSIYFNNYVAEKTFANEKFLGKKITIISVLGPSRSGKSFLMAVLTNKGDDKEIEGFFQSGYDRCTKGIFISSQPEYLSDDHVVFYLDTQGTFDLQTEPKISAWIAGFSLLVSDIQIINLRGNIGGDDLQDLHLFTEMVSSMNGVQFLSKQLIFLIRDARNSSKDEIFLDQLWLQASQSKKLQKISASLRSKFSLIKCFCAPPASDRIRRANGKIQIELEDQPLLQKLNLVKESLLTSSKSLDNQPMRKTIDYAKKVCEFLQSKHNIFDRTSVQLIKEATAVYASNKAFSVFEGLFLKAKQENYLQIYEERRREAFNALKEIVHPKDFAEAEKLLSSKITKLFTVKELELKEEAAQKGDQLNIEKFLSRELSKIQKLEFETLLKLKRENQIELIVAEFVKTLNRFTDSDFLSIKTRLEDRLEYQFLFSREGHLKKYLDELVKKLREKILAIETCKRNVEEICPEEIRLSFVLFSDELKRTGVDEEKTDELILFAKEEFKKFSFLALRLHRERRVATELLNTLTKQLDISGKKQATEPFSVETFDKLDTEDRNIDDVQFWAFGEHEETVNDKGHNPLPQNDTREELEAQLQAEILKLIHSQNQLNPELRTSERRSDVETNYESPRCLRNLKMEADLDLEKPISEETLIDKYINNKIIVFHSFEQGLTDFQNKAMILQESIEDFLQEFEIYCEVQGFASELIAIKRESLRKDLSLLAGELSVNETSSDLVVVESHNVSSPERTATIIRWISQSGRNLFKIIHELTVSLFQ